MIVPAFFIRINDSTILIIIIVVWFSTEPICIPLILLGIVPFKSSFTSYVVVTNVHVFNTKFSVCEIEIKSVICCKGVSPIWTYFGLWTLFITFFIHFFSCTYKPNTNFEFINVSKSFSSFFFLRFKKML